MLTQPSAVFAPYHAKYFASGTAALAAALCVAKRCKHSPQPEVLLPAYGCPDLVSAALYAGLKPVLVDLAPERPWFDLDALARAINANTVAIVAVNLFGLGERMTALLALAKAANVVLIEDSAQAFPMPGETDFWQGDMVVLSFGRGKPVSLLGGGAVLFKGTECAAGLSELHLEMHIENTSSALFWLRSVLYNRLISPRCYWLLAALPFLHLGETRYHPLRAIASMDRAHLARLAANITAYQQAHLRVQTQYAQRLAAQHAGQGLIDLARACTLPATRRLLRYPLLLHPGQRDARYQLLQRKGLGASVMYPRALALIDGLGDCFAGQGSFPQAQQFAARLLALPVQDAVSAQDIEQIMQVLTA